MGVMKSLSAELFSVCVLIFILNVQDPQKLFVSYVVLSLCSIYLFLSCYCSRAYLGESSEPIRRSRG